jgi:hypothetical protein
LSFKTFQEIKVSREGNRRFLNKSQATHHQLNSFVISLNANKAITAFDEEETESKKNENQRNHGTIG